MHTHIHNCPTLFLNFPVLYCGFVICVLISFFLVISFINLSRCFLISSAHSVYCFSYFLSSWFKKKSFRITSSFLTLRWFTIIYIYTIIFVLAIGYARITCHFGCSRRTCHLSGHQTDTKAEEEISMASSVFSSQITSVGGAFTKSLGPWPHAGDSDPFVSWGITTAACLMLLLLLWPAWTLCCFLLIKSQRSPVGREFLVSILPFSKSSATRAQFTANLQWRGQHLEVTVLVESGADESMIETALVRQLGICTQTLPRVKRANALNGQPLAKVRYCTQPVTLLISGNHSEKISLHLIDTPQVPLVRAAPPYMQNTCSA